MQNITITVSIDGKTVWNRYHDMDGNIKTDPIPTNEDTFTAAKALKDAADCLDAECGAGSFQRHMLNTYKQKLDQESNIIKWYEEIMAERKNQPPQTT